jgi:hypothetical protein
LAPTGEGDGRHDIQEALESPKGVRDEAGRREDGKAARGSGEAAI